jgi:hypothetical protein
MAKTQDNKRKIDQAIGIVAKMYGVTLSYVRMIRDGQRNNQQILDTYTKITQETSTIIKAAQKSIQKKNQ